MSVHTITCSILILSFYDIVLNPRYKLQYFKQAKWPEDWINTAKDITRDEYERSYAHKAVDSEATTDDVVIVANGVETTKSTAAAAKVSSKNSRAYVNIVLTTGYSV